MSLRAFGLDWRRKRVVVLAVECGGGAFYTNMIHQFFPEDPSATCS